MRARDAFNGFKNRETESITAPQKPTIIASNFPSQNDLMAQHFY